MRTINVWVIFMVLGSKVMHTFIARMKGETGYEATKYLPLEIHVGDIHGNYRCSSHQTREEEDYKDDSKCNQRIREEK